MATSGHLGMALTTPWWQAAYEEPAGNFSPRWPRRPTLPPHPGTESQAGWRTKCCNGQEQFERLPGDFSWGRRVAR